MSHHLFIVSGPSGAGKTSVALGVLKKLPSLSPGISYTTRLKRGQEEDKIMYHISQEKFQKKIKNKDFLEWALVHNHLYGTPRYETLELLKKYDVILNIDVQGALQIKKRIPSTHLIFIKPESFSRLVKRIKKRGRISQEDLKIRLKNAKKEIAQEKRYDFAVINRENKLAETIKKVAKIIQKLTK